MVLMDKVHRIIRYRMRAIKGLMGYARYWQPIQISKGLGDILDRNFGHKDRKLFINESKTRQESLSRVTAKI